LFLFWPFFKSTKNSIAINSLTDELAVSSLWDDAALRKSVLADAIPKLLQDLVVRTPFLFCCLFHSSSYFALQGLDVLIGRVPENYLRAMFSSFLASRFEKACFE
jgi:glutamate dehydrogenase